MPVLLFENFPVTIVSQGNVPVYQSPIGYPPSSGLYPTEILLQVKCKPEEAQENVADQEFKFIAGRHVVRLFARGKEYDEQPMDDGLVCYSALVAAIFAAGTTVEDDMGLRNKPKYDPHRVRPDVALEAKQKNGEPWMKSRR